MFLTVPLIGMQRAVLHVWVETHSCQVCAVPMVASGFLNQWFAGPQISVVCSPRD